MNSVASSHLCNGETSAVCRLCRGPGFVKMCGRATPFPRHRQDAMHHRILPLAACLLFACSTPPAGGSTATADGAALKFGDGYAASDSATATDAVSDVPVLADGASCVEGTSICHNDMLAKTCVGGQWQLKENCTDGKICYQGACATPGNCEPGSSQGCGGYTTELVCSDDGKVVLPKKCSGQQQCAAGKCRAVVCTPGIAECNTQKDYKICSDDGQGYGDPVSCKTGATCFGGKCLSLCEANLKVASNVGCEYWSADLPNYPDPFKNAQGLTPEDVPHSVVVSNPGVYDATITFTVQAVCGDGSQCIVDTQCKTKMGGKVQNCGDLSGAAYPLVVPNPVVPAGKAVEFKMPVMNVQGDGIWDKGIHITSDQPVVAWQFNPFNAEGAASNDGSLLLPQNALGKQYYAVTRPSGVAMMGNLPAQSGYFTVIAASKGTTNVSVTLTAKVAGNPSVNIPALAAGQTFKVALQQYQVLNLEGLSVLDFKTPPADLTGSYISADKPIAVFGGHEEDVENLKSIPGDGCCAEHVEEQLMPLESWGSEALCVKTHPRGNEPDIWIVMAGEDNVQLKTNPPIADLDGKVLAKAGDRIETNTPLSFFLQATGKIQVVQLILSEQQTQQNIGDPTMMIIPPKSQYRSDYVILTAQGYDKKNNWTSVVRPAGVEVKLDGQVLPASDFTPFGDGSWEIAYESVTTGGHSFEGKEPFGLMVYGYGNATAYGYPGGMNLK